MMIAGIDFQSKGEAHFWRRERIIEIPPSISSMT
jgi:hypothetical protein